MKTLAQINNDAKTQVQQEVIGKLRRAGWSEVSNTWNSLRLDQNLWMKLESHDLTAPQRLAALKKVAFPGYNREEVDAALDAGNNLNDLYAIARGRARLFKKVDGTFMKGKKGLLILK